MENKLPDWLINRIPSYGKVETISQVFEDSTHKLFRLTGSNENGETHFLKVCNNTQSPFWQVMHDLFAYDLCTEIADFSKTYEFIANASYVNIPRLIKAETVDSNAYILASELSGSAVGTKISNEMVEQLANHLAKLHAKTSNTWGSLNCPDFNDLAWNDRLETTLLKSASRALARQRSSAVTPIRRANEMSKKWGGVILNSDKHLKTALEACRLIESTIFVPLMPDLRWDQFLHNENGLSALVDLDAFVFAPRELDFVILEYILSPDQAVIFKEIYSKHHAIPTIKPVRSAYRLLLFYMQILGETDLDIWMNEEALFN